MLAPLLLSLLAAPPVPPPEPDRHAAAIRLWEEHPPSEISRRSAIDATLYNAAAAALVNAGMRPSDRRWLARSDALRERLRARIPADRTAIDRQVVACAAQGLAYALSVEEIEEARRFLSTPTGNNFWNAMSIGRDSLQGCYASVLELHARDDDYRAVGLRPPRPRFRPGEIVS